MATNGSFSHQEQYKASAEQGAIPATDAITTAGSNNDLTKDQIGWIFIEQYYTTLSKSPERLHLFYHKRSQFVAGVEAEVANVSVGRQAIQERIKKLDFQDTKVRVSNVDSQASFDGIVIQVIGEVSNKAGEPKKFVQTFVLAQQPTGYFVLNDILRYIDDDDQEAQETTEANTEGAEAEEVKAEAEPAAEPVKPVEAASEESSAALDVKAVEQKLEEASTAEEAAPAAEEKVEAEKPADKSEAAKPDPETTAKDLAEEDAEAAEKPQDPAPSPAVKETAQPEPAAPEPTGPPKPMTWASRAAAAAGPRPVVPLPKTATPPAQSQSRAPAPTEKPAAAPAEKPAEKPVEKPVEKPAEKPAAPAPAPAAAPAAAAPATEAQPKEATGWQTAGVDSKRQNRPQSISAAPADKEGTLGYVKYVTDKVQEGELKKALEGHGELAYFDINRQKNCAFVEYKTAEGLQAALGSNPHSVNGEQIIVEQRRPKANTYGGNNFGSGRGSQRGRGGFDGNRNGGQGNNRGNFSGQNRGRGAPRGRGGAQANNA